MINIQFYRDQDGYFRAEADAKYALLSQFFESEVQGLAEVCLELLDEIRKIEDGTLSHSEGVGNAIGCKITTQQVTLWNEFAENPTELVLSLKDFQQLLQACLLQIQAIS